MRCLCFRLVCFSVCIYNRTTTHNNRTNKQRLGENIKQNRTTQKYIISQPEPERYLFAVPVLGWISCMSVFVCFFCFEAFLFYVCLFMLCFRFRLVALSFYLQSKTHMQKHKQLKQTRRTQTKTTHQKHT